MPLLQFRDASGTLIDYGNRWGMDSPPDETYSVTSNLERFEPLHTVADALIAWLVATYDATAVDAPEAVAASTAARIPASRAVRVTPADDSAAPLTFVFTDFPGVVLHAGVLYRTHAPACGCDACDENWEHGAEELEFTVRAVVTGGFTERVTGRIKTKVYQSLELPGVGGRSGEGPARDMFSEGEIEAARSRLRSVGTWRPWPTT
jgi:hypothetical protein